jgi:mono/diheme cytochrome c family protein
VNSFFLRLTFLVSLLPTLPVLAAAEEPVSFNEHIRPILADNCFACHGSDSAHRKAKLRLDQFESATADRNGFRALIPGDVANSEMWQRIISNDPDEIMPPPDSHKPPLKPAQRELLRRWIEQGAVYQNHWAFEPISRPAIPVTQLSTLNSQLSPNPIDAFIRQKLARQKLTPAPAAPPEVLLRRLTLDLTGLPPTPAELTAFLSDPIENRESKIENLVTRLLASPRYGEHFARYWLDAVRYSDTHGLHLDNIRHIWPYRDWVVRAFNANLPFDRFTLQQLAGDLLPDAELQAPSTDLPAARLNALIASGYNRLHLTTSEGGAIEAEAEARNTADRTDTTAAVFLGLTAGCAACHDHKFDPLTQRDYYALGAFWKSLADRPWDGNVRVSAPIVVIADSPATQARIAELASAIRPLEAALAARTTQLLADSPPAKPEKEPITYEVIWAEDSDLANPADLGVPAALGEWRSGPDVPVAGGQRALRLEGGKSRPFNFTAGDVILTVRSDAKAFIHFLADPARPPRAVSLEFISPSNQTTRFVWGDPTAFSPKLGGTRHVGPLPPPGTYARLEIDACEAGLDSGKAYTGLAIAQSDGAAWWDRAGATLTSPDASADPLLSRAAWNTNLQANARFNEGMPLRHDIKYLIGLSGTQQNAEEKTRLDRYHREHIYAPYRAVLEPEAHAARRLLSEQIHYELKHPMTLVSGERTVPLPAHILVRGQYDKPGDLVEPATPSFLPPLRVASPASNSSASPRPTRLDFARWLVDPQNPLTARVTVNRFWQQLFGAGLVRTPADFGVQGDAPTHPELLDWLASEFVRSGWDVKKLVRLIVTSETYRQSSDVTPALLELDPSDRLLARAPRLRLDGEVLRDQALALSGLLVPTIGGAPVRPYQPINIWEPVAFGGSNTKTYVRDDGPALYRRSLYTFWKRTAPAPAMSTFDAPSRETFCTGRGRSNTPLQALALMNDVQQFEAARAFAENLLAADSADAPRLAAAFRAVTAREPDATERDLLTSALATHRTHYGRDPDAAEKVLTNGASKSKSIAPTPEIAAWTMVANLLFNLDETITRN